MTDRVSKSPAIVHLDEHLIVVNKPPGMLSRRGTNREPGVPEFLQQDRRFPPDGSVLVVHRLDREASGVMVLARTADAQRHLSAQFKARQVGKRYIAIVRGQAPAEGQIDLRLATTGNGTRARVSRKKGRDAHTAFRVLERVAGHSLVECRPTTGRLHQIRVHMAAIGHPLAVDTLYGGGEPILLSNYKYDYRLAKHREEKPLIARLALHAISLEFDHPDGSGRVVYETDLPKDFRATLTQLRKYVDTASAPRGE